MAKHRANLDAILIDAAKKVLERSGMEKLSARTVAREADCSVGTIYNYYESMNALILRINGQTLNLLLERLQVAFEEAADSGRSVGHLIAEHYMLFAQENMPYWTLLFEHKLPPGEDYPDWYQKQVDDIFAVVREALRPFLPKDPEQARKATHVLWAGFHGIIVLNVSGKLALADAGNPIDLCESLFDHYLSGF